MRVTTELPAQEVSQMVPYTAVDLIRTMNEELVERHQQAAFRHQWQGAFADRPPAVSLRSIVKRGRR
jgi:hypothetical protein